MIKMEKVQYKNILYVESLVFKENTFNILKGTSGCGKTTLLKLLNKMISPCEGEIYYRGQDYKTIDSVGLRRKIMLLSQNPVIFQGTISDNLNMGLIFQNRSSRNDSEIKSMLERLNLDKNPDSDASLLSGGEKQRIALGRILLLNPEVYLLDEPTSSLDSETEKIIFSLIEEEVKERGKTVIMVNHSLATANIPNTNVCTLKK